MRRAQYSQRGFTLLELLIAIAVFAIMSTMAFSGLNAVTRARKTSEEHAQQLAALQTAFLWIGKDIEQATPRPVRDQFGETQAAMQSTQAPDLSLEFTHTGWSNPFPSEKRQRSMLQRVAYDVHEKQLLRKYWFDLDREYQSPVFETALLDDVTSVEFRYVDRNLQWQTQWPPLEKTDALPQAVEVSIDLNGVGKITRLFRIAEGVAPKKVNP